MRRGELTNEPAPMVAVDWRVLVETKRRLLFGPLRTELRWKDGAKGWLERNWKRRFCVVMAGDEHLTGRVKEMMNELVAEFEWFAHPVYLRMWIQRNPQVVRLYTDDIALLGLNETIRQLAGWHETV